MNLWMRRLAVTAAGLGLAFFLTGFQIGKYPMRKTQWGQAETTHRKVFKEQSEAEIKKYMEKMCKDIGVKCGFCHNVKDYASEEKPEKDFGRHKIQLVKWLNDKYRPAGATWEYSCYTCHRGVMKPVPSAAALVPGARLPAKGR